MKKFPDISEYYVGNKVALEEEGWNKTKEYVRNWTVLRNTIEEYNLKSVIELGCGSGLVASCVPTDLPYLGIDKSPHFLEMAKGREANKGREFYLEDIRKVNLEWLEKMGLKKFDIACSFAFHKHFGLHECDDITRNILALGRYAVVQVQVSEIDVDDGIDFHHTSITRDRWESVLASAGHKLIDELLTYDGNLSCGVPMQDYIFISKSL